ncbi:Protein ZINC INDUCED FACILITATOR-LIKE 1 [Striga hermonthica]|uniref:Protein ZINC INDUCED FACILITATOR-LIKE 1 n=1 Tax=Striga hermonthica TaxID=68872 RepID=A0A9N7NBR9_STRHE|nr:Protein ZINC INDUCED FACILITATOR-LIKE 1 [Striga hermonthica]
MVYILIFSLRSYYSVFNIQRLSWAELRQKASLLPGVHLVFFALNVVEFLGFVFTFRPFLALPQDEVLDSKNDPENN